MRKFGKILFLEKSSLEVTKDLKNLGPEPLEKSFTPKMFKERLLLRPNGKIKAVLLDQSIVVGIGNIYSDEMLWETGIHPETRVEKLNDKHFQAVYKSMKKILTHSIKVRGDSKGDYRDIYGRRGSFQNLHKAYGRTNLPCPKKGCRGIIRRIVVGSRSAHFCEKHQKKLG
jgi:formamidopyrimidine-DNA glycosylase